MPDVQLIDAHALVKDLRLMAKYQPPYKCSTILGVCSTIEARTPIDAVPVVRCKDCKHRGTSYDCPFRHLMFTEADGYHYVDKTTDDGFCSFGVWKEEYHGSD